MTTQTTPEAIGTLERARTELQLIASAIESQVRTASSVFQELAGHTDAMLSLAATIVGCVENESIRSILPKAQGLGAAARKLIGERLQATSGILETVAMEAHVLQQLTQVTGQQAQIAMKTKALSVLTNVEVAHLGSVTTGFQYLAHELSDFSKLLMEDSMILESRTEARRITIEETRRLLSSELPRLREKLGIIEKDLGKDLAALDSSLSQLSGSPVQFKACVQDIDAQITGVVGAIQAHDITRQQAEHVEEAFLLISAKLRSAEESASGVAQEFPQAYAGLTIQIYQLEAIKVTLKNWTSQIKTCMDGILRVSASEMVGIGPMVLAQEREVSRQLAHIELLEGESQSHSARIRHTLEGLSSLLLFVREHVQRSASIRDRLRLLSFNSIIEASHFGSKAQAVLAIANSIKEISAEWSEITDLSGQAMEEILKLVKQTDKAMDAFSEARNESLHEAENQTRVGLEGLRTAAAFAAKQSKEMETIMVKMQSKSAEMSGADNLLEASSDRMAAILTPLELLRHEMEADQPGVGQSYDAEEAEQFFSATYTTEIEREVLRAALRGSSLPVLAQQVFEGNSVELF
jgi:hypothetical protein